jgi:hypothetical protein
MRMYEDIGRFWGSGKWSDSGRGDYLLKLTMTQAPSVFVGGVDVMSVMSACVYV